MRIQIIHCERDQKIVLLDNEDQELFSQIQTYDEMGSAGRDAVKDIVIGLAEALSIPYDEDEVVSLDS